MLTLRTGHSTNINPKPKPTNPTEPYSHMNIYEYISKRQNMFIKGLLFQFLANTMRLTQWNLLHDNYIWTTL